MNLIMLNTWGGRKAGLLTDFFKQYKDEVAIFCLQEVSHDPQEENLVFSDNNPNFLKETSSVLEDYNYH